MKFYFDHEGESCYQLDYWKEQMNEWDLSELTLFDAKMEVGNGYFYCVEFGTSGESGRSDCGKWCEKYNPRNGKNGRCVHSANTYEMTDKIKILKIK